MTPFLNRRPSSRFRRACAGAVVAFLCGVAPLRAADRLGNLKASHPRLLFSEADFARTRVWCDIDSLTRKTWLSLKAKGEQFLTRPALTYALDPTPQQRLLAVSREALERISLLAALYRLDGDVRYRDGAVQVLRTVSAFPDWHPSHFLDASEMTFAVALGYDWLHKDLTPGLRDTLRVAIATKGLRPGMDAYRGKANSWWVKSTNNWNQVCNAGLAIGALAIAEDSTALSRSVVDSVLWSLPVSMDASYAPDGGFVEGVGYWEYGTNYTVYLLGSLQSALGSTFGLMESPGFDRTADYRLQMVGPTNLRYDYADQSVTNNFVSSMFWFAKAFDRPFYARTERINPGTPNIFALMWYDPELAAKPDAYALPLAERYDRLDVAVFRSSWSDAGAWYVGFKGGDNAASHAHLDQGSFVMEKDGVRWVSDLGSDNYGVPNYFVDTKSQAGAHWQMYRTRTEGHGTLTISDRVQVPLAFPSQSITAVAPLVDFHDGAIDAWAIADLTSSYQPIATDARAVTRAHRGIRLWPESQMLVQDEVVSSAPVEVVWNLLTEAAVSLEGSAMTMARKGKTMRAEILAPVGARFDTVTCHPPDSRIQAQKDAGLAAENPNQGYTKVIVRLPMGVVDATLAVRFFPGGTAPLAPSLLPLSRWKESASGVAEPSGRASLGRGKVAVELGTGRRIALDRPLPVGKQLVNRDGRLRLVLVK